MSDKKLNIAIIGAGGALGGEFVRQLSKSEKTGSIFAFSSSNLDFESEKVQTDFINIEDEESIKAAANKASKDNALDMVIVAIGMLHDQELMPEKSLRDLSKEKFIKLFSVNTIAPAIIAKHFLPKLNKESQSIFAAISARVGSISDNHLGGWYAYRASKTALNMVLKNSSIEIKRSNKNAIIIGLHPGTVDSNLSKPFQSSVKKEKLFTAQHSVEMLLKVLENLNPSNSGFIFDFNGIKIDE